MTLTQDPFTMDVQKVGIYRYHPRHDAQREQYFQSSSIPTADSDEV
jgi:hypothetical protein